MMQNFELPPPRAWHSIHTSGFVVACIRAQQQFNKTAPIPTSLLSVASIFTDIRMSLNLRTYQKDVKLSVAPHSIFWPLCEREMCFAICAAHWHSFSFFGSLIRDAIQYYDSTIRSSTVWMSFYSQQKCRNAISYISNQAFQRKFTCLNFNGSCCIRRTELQRRDTPTRYLSNVATPLQSYANIIVRKCMDYINPDHQHSRELLCSQALHLPLSENFQHTSISPLQGGGKGL